MAKQEVIRYKTRDGLDIEGLLVHPLDRKGNERVPLVTIVHGGPEAHFSNGWINGYSQPVHVLAAQGFASFLPNYRSSTGRGVAFSKLGFGKPGMGEFDDIVDGVDHLIATGLVDKVKVGITGGSYGGYASAWGATYYSERFAAAVTFVGISDQASLVTTGDIPWEQYLVHMGKWPWEDPEMFRQQSPITHAQKSRTPTLILHGEADPRVPPMQSYMLYRYLKLAGKAPVRLVLYPGEGHGNQRAASRYDYSLRLMQWMKHYLTGPGGEPPAYQVDYALPKK
ncbi:alpha/beta hydrolase family protein [Lysobacter brunescens]|uniref:Alpha/beta hydrolase family protein n=1 Tax=Lysobacter brunescens TaxID=262323 RepID=A0ABW2YDN0_9GAMM